MKLPTFCYQKAFWVILSVLIASMTSGMVAVNNQIQALEDRVTETQVTLAENNIPELKKVINAHFEKVDNDLDLIQKQNIYNYKLLCKINNGEC